jgi:hypothetical protein
MDGGHRTPLKFKYKDVLYAEGSLGKRMGSRKMLRSNEVKVATCLYKLGQPLPLSSFEGHFASVIKEAASLGIAGQSE